MGKKNNTTAFTPKSGTRRHSPDARPNRRKQGLFCVASFCEIKTGLCAFLAVAWGHTKKRQALALVYGDFPSCSPLPRALL